MSAEKSVKKIRIMTETGCSCVAERLFFRMMNVKRIALSFLLLAFFAVLVSAVGFDNKASSPLLILSSILALLFLCLLLYVLKIRPEMIGNIRKEDRMQGEGIFTPSSFSVDFGEGKINLDYKAIKGQFWYGDHYFLFIDSKNYRSIVAFPVVEGTFDSVYMLADSLTRRKIRLVQIKSKNKKGENE